MKNEVVDFRSQTERMIKISKAKPLLPQEFIPWNDIPTDDTIYMPDRLVSLEGSDLWGDLSSSQQKELGKLEMGQVMFSYAWSETLACGFFNRHLLTLDPTSVEYKFLIRELIEEYRHQEMFGMAIEKLGVKPIKPSWFYKTVAHLCVKFGGQSVVFMGVLAIELMADIYAKHIRRDPLVYSVLRKTSELHHIEEGRHIFYTKMWLKKFTDNAGVIRSSIYSLVVLGSILFLKSLYVQKTFFEKIGLENSDKYYKAAVKNYDSKFSEFAMSETIDFVKSIRGFNWFTRPIWRRTLKVNV